MDEQTEWMDERPDDSPFEKPAPTFKELFEQIAAVFQTTVKEVVEAYKPIAKAFQGMSIHGDYQDEWTESNPGPPTFDQLMKEKQRKNHGPRQGGPYGPNGKRNW